MTEYSPPTCFRSVNETQLVDVKNPQQREGQFVQVHTIIVKLITHASIRWPLRTSGKFPTVSEFLQCAHDQAVTQQR